MRQFLVDLHSKTKLMAYRSSKNVGINAQSVLVTSYSNSSDVRSRCDALQSGCFPRAPSVAFLIHSNTNTSIYDAVLIDDDAMFRKIWKRSASSRGLCILAFASVREFYDVATTISKNTPVYIEL